MKKFLALAAGAALSLSIFGGSEKASASSEAPMDSLQVEAFKEQALESLRKDYPNIQILNLTPEELEQQKKLKSVLAITPYASAPPVTSLAVRQVTSQMGTPDQFTESIKSNQLTSHTVKGTVGIGVLEVGYGNDNHWLGSERITYSHPDYESHSELLDYNNDRIIDAFYHSVFFDSDVKIPAGTSKVYKFQSISQNSPWNTMVTTINIPHE